MDGCDAKCWNVGIYDMWYVNYSDCWTLNIHMTIKLRPIRYWSGVGAKNRQLMNAIHVSNRTNGQMNTKDKYLHFKCVVISTPPLQYARLFIFFNFPLLLLSELIWNDKSFTFGFTEKIQKKQKKTTTNW